MIIISIIAVLGAITEAATYGPSSTATAATNPSRINSTQANRQVTITAKTSLNVNTGTGGDLFVAELYTTNASCDANSFTPSCQSSCSPYTSPNIASKSCLSSNRISVVNGPNWVVGTVLDNSDGTYTAVYAPEVAGTYDLSIGLANVGGLRGKYYDNMWFLNSPTINRIDPTISFDWGLGALTTYGVDYVSVRWEGKLKPSYSQTYTIYVTADDGVRLWLDRRLVIDRWDTCCNETWANVALTANFLHDIKIDYREITGSANIDLMWSSPSVAKEVIPSTALYNIDQIANSPFKGIVFKEGDPPKNTKTTAAGTGLSSPIVAGTPVLANLFTINAKDEFGNPLTAQSSSAVWSITGSGPGSVNSSVSYFSGSTYNASWSTYIVGSYSLAVKLGGLHIVGSPFSVSCVPAVTSPGNSIAYGPGLSSATVGVSTSFWIQARDTYSNNVTWGTDPVKVTLSGTNAPSAGVTYLRNGLYQVYYTPVISGSLTVSVKIGTTPILTSSGSFSVTVAVGAVSIANCTSSPPTTAIAGIQSSFSIIARDQFGNQMITGGGGVAFTLALTGPATLAQDSITHAGSGVYTALFTPTLAGVYKMIIQSGGVNISGNPFSVTVSPGAAVASTSTATGASLSNAVSGILQMFNVSVRDSQSNLIANNSATVVTTLDCGSVTGSSVWNGSGIYTTSYTPTTKGSACSLSVKIGGSHISGSPFTVNVAAGSATASTSTVTGTGLSSSVAGAAVGLTINLKDSASNLLVRGGNRIYVIVTQPDSTTLPSSISDLGTGSYTVAYTPVQAGSHSLSVKLAQVGGLDATYYSDSYMSVTYSSNVLSTTVDHVWGYLPAVPGLPADMFSVRWTGSILPPTSELYRFFISLYANTGVRLYINSILVINAWTSALGAGDVFGDIALVANQPADITIEFHADLGKAQIRLFWSSDSIPKSIVPSTALFYNRHVASSPYTGISVTQAALNRNKTTASGNCLTSLTVPVATSTAVTVTARDTYGNLDIAGGQQGSFTSSLAAVYSSTTVTPVITNVGGSSGQYLVTFTATVAGAYTLSIYLSNQHIYGSPWTLNVPVGSTAPANTIVSGSGAASAVAGVPNNFLLTVQDGSGNLRAVGGDAITVTMFNNPTYASVNIIDRGDGTYTCNYTGTVSGTYVTSITVNGVSIGASINTVVSPAAASATTTVVSGGTPATPNSGIASSFTINSYDAYSNARTSGGHFFFVSMTDKSNNVYRGTVTDSGNGNYVVGYTLPSISKYRYNVMLASGSASSGDGLLGEYFHNRWLDGDPIMTRVDKFIDFQWGTDLITATAKDYVSIRWSGYFRPIYAQTYTFYCTVYEQARLWVNDILIIDAWSTGSSVYNGTYAIPTASSLYSVKLEFRKTTGTGQAMLEWSSTSQTRQVIPQTNLFSSAQHISGSPFLITVTT